MINNVGKCLIKNVKGGIIFCCRYFIFCYIYDYICFSGMRKRIVCVFRKYFFDYL